MAIPVQELWNAWRDMQGQADKAVRVNLYGAAGTAREGLLAAFADGGNRPGAVRARDLEAPAAGGRGLPAEWTADIHLGLLEADFGPTSAQLAFLRQLPPKALVLLVVGVAPERAGSRQREVAIAVGLRLEQVLVAESVTALLPALAAQLVAQFDELTVPLARQFAFLRDEAAEQEIRATAQQNGVVGLLPIPGADMPLMTANQVKMILRLAAIHDQPMTWDRLKEVLGVVGGGLAMRTAARQVAKFIPGAGWLVGGAMGYGGTLGMGKLAIAYFRTTHPEPALRRSRGGDGAPGAIDAEATVVDGREP